MIHQSNIRVDHFLPILWRNIRQKMIEAISNRHRGRPRGFDSVWYGNDPYFRMACTWTKFTVTCLHVALIFLLTRPINFQETYLPSGHCLMAIAMLEAMCHGIQLEIVKRSTGRLALFGAWTYRLNQLLLLVNLLEFKLSLPSLVTDEKTLIKKCNDL